MAKFEEKLKARNLRRNGESIKVIARLLNVSSSSVSIWCRDVKLTLEQITTLEKRARDPHYGRRLSYSLAQQKKRLEKIKKLKKEGIKDIGKLENRELFLTGAALYWAEGFKKDSQAGFANSDPQMIRFILKWLNKCCGYKPEDLIFRVTININHQHRIRDIEMYWAEILKVDLSNFQKSFYQKVTWKKVYEKPNDYYGILRIKVRRSTDFLRKINGWIEGLKLQAEG
jgi:hypothetical protein